MAEIIQFPRDIYADPEPEPVYMPQPQQQIIRVHLVQPEPVEPSTGSKVAFILACAVLGLMVSLAVF